MVLLNLPNCSGSEEPVIVVGSFSNFFRQKYVTHLNTAEELRGRYLSFPLFL